MARAAKLIEAFPACPAVNIGFTKIKYPSGLQKDFFVSKILIVDDDAHIRELVRVFLRADGFEVIEAADGVEALSILDSARMDLAVIDVMMPNMDGWQLCQELKATFDMPVLMLTARGETSQKLKGFQLGTDDYLVKPFEPLELVARVKALLKRYRVRIFAANPTGQPDDRSENASDHRSWGEFYASVEGVRVVV